MNNHCFGSKGTTSPYLLETLSTILKTSEFNTTIRSEKEIKDLLRHIARSLGQALEPVENQGSTENTKSVTGNTIGTSISVALVTVNPFEKNRLAQQKEFFFNHAGKAPTLEEACRQLDIKNSEAPWMGA